MVKPNVILRVSLGLVLTLLALGVPATVQAETNVVPNPGFETADCSRAEGGAGSTICGWRANGAFMFRDLGYAHSGEASMGLNCGPIGCWPGSVGATTEPDVCTPIRPGSHAASFWYRAFGGEEWVALSAAFFRTPDCTGKASGDTVGDWAIADSLWNEMIGDLSAPAGTESAFFYLGASRECDDYCSVEAYFDDLDVESQVGVAFLGPPIRLDPPIRE